MSATNARAPSDRAFGRIVAAFLLIMVAFYALSTTGFFEARVFQPYLELNARVAGAVLGWLGYDTHATGASIFSGELSVNIARGCDASEPSALFVAAMLAFPAPLTLKLWGILFGLVMLAMLNIVRIVSLFLVVVHSPSMFHTVHTEIWQVVFIAIAILLFSLWLLWATRSGARGHVRA